MRKTFLTSLTVTLLVLVARGAGAQSATIHRDVWGVPHVLSDTDAGAVFGMAWALAEDDWTLIEQNYLHALGRYAELVGENGVADDWMSRALQIVPFSIAEYNAASPRIRTLLDAFAAGMNGWLATRPDSARILTSIEPWYPLALIRYKYYQNEFLGYAGLRDAWANRLFRGEWPLRAGERMHDEGAGAEHGSETEAKALPRYYEAQFDELGFRPRGSNQWAVAPGRTAAGHALLLINPHQSFVGVQRYAEIHLDSREGLRFSGLTVFGFLLPYMGHNEALGWAYTDNYADHSDLYGEVFDDPADPMRYRYGDGYRTAESWTDSIYVRTSAGLAARTFRFWKTHHGPIVGVADDGRPLAVRLARFNEGGWYDQWDAMLRAQSLEQWRAAVSMLQVPYMNTMYADRDGNIGYIYNSAVPRRHEGINPRGILDGSDPRTEWQGFHSLDELPQVFNPASGWLLNTNSTPFTATTNVPYDAGSFPDYMIGPETHNPRARSSRRVLERMSRVTFDEFAVAVWDSYLTAAELVLPQLMEQWRNLAGDTLRNAGWLKLDTLQRADVANAIDRFRRWDRTADSASVETTWFVLMTEKRGQVTAGTATAGAEWVFALLDALRTVRSEWGSVDVPWGRLNRHQRPLPGAAPRVLDRDRPSLPVGGASGGLGAVFTYHSVPVGSAAARIGAGGNSFVKVIEFGPLPRGRSILNYGQSGDPGSPHFFDQASLYVQRRFKPAHFTREDVVANSVRSYTVGSGN